MTIERYKICIDHIDHILGWMLSRFVIETISSSKSKELGNQIVSDIKEAFIQGFHKLDWMDNSVKKLASEKVRKITQMIGYPSTVSIYIYITYFQIQCSVLILTSYSPRISRIPKHSGTTTQA